MIRRRSRRSRAGKRVGLRGLLLFLAAAVVCVALVYKVSNGFLDSAEAKRTRTGEAAAGKRALPGRPSKKKQSPPTRAEAGAESPAEPAAMGDEEAEAVDPSRYDGLTSPPSPGRGARVAVVIDDLGRSLREVAALEALAMPLTYAVLPFETLTLEVTARLRESEVEIMLHLPMEPEGGANPGPGALSRAMTDAELSGATRDAVAAVAGAAGVNNHMGSSLSTDPRAMRAILEVLAREGLYFLDSRTSAESVAYREASELGLPAAERQVFLDRDADPREIAFQFRRLLDLARERGSAIAIGHPYPVTVEVLAREVPLARSRGYEFVPVSAVLDRTGIESE